MNERNTSQGSILTYQELQVSQAEPLRLLQVLQEPSRCCDYDMGLLRKRNLLWLDVDTADDSHAAHAHRGPYALELLADLEGELARRRNDTREEPLRVFPELLQDGECERSGFAGARRGNTDDVAPLQRMGEHF